MNYNHLPSFAFGDGTAEMADELLDLVLKGQKTATCSDFESYSTENHPLPKKGDQFVVLNGREEPCCVIEVTDVCIQQFNEVGLEFAKAEGEGDRTLEYWQKTHKTFFTNMGTYSEDMRLVCEHFTVIDILKG